MSTAPAPIAYPVRVEAHLDPHLSRGLWLVKWFLAIPHYVVLAFLSVAFVVTGLMAFFAILVTGRYPRALFDFNVGVLRWAWRVCYYSYGALGTDRYPPFTLHDVAEYPAHLEIDYPQHLSRRLVLVKWWLLAIPHYLILGLLLGGVGYASQESNGDVFSGMGLIGLLVLVAGVILLFTGGYPLQLFDLVLGLNRWVLRVAGYAALMTDRYPPFALDQGGLEPGTVREPPGVAPAAAADPHGEPAGPAMSHQNKSGWTAGRVASLVTGSVLIMMSLGLGGAAGTLAVVDQSQRDQAGFLMSDSQAFNSPSHAITSSDLQLHTDAPGTFLPGRLLGDVRLTAASATDQEIFLGIGPTAAVDRYLGGVGHETLTDIDDGEPVYTAHAGAAPAATPADQELWVAQDSGAGEQIITWPLEEGDWTAVLMNSEGGAAIAAEVTVGAELPALRNLVILLAILAVPALVAGAVLVALPLRTVSRGAHDD